MKPIACHIAFAALAVLMAICRPEGLWLAASFATLAMLKTLAVECCIQEDMDAP